ncbi:MAG: hypothetical protein HY304_06705 [candidate division Zixibacteria bacterium]|nr:hypothetical protein [candidate division Zixibacteria bacterium]
MLARVKIVGFYIGAFALTVAAGWLLGSTVGAHRAEVSHAAYMASQRDYLLEHVRGIARGNPFPRITLWSVDGVRTAEIGELLPKGGLLVLVGPGCASCLEAGTALDSALTLAGPKAVPAILVTDQAEKSDAFAELLTVRGVHVPVYCDTRESLRREYKVLANPVYFRLDSQLVVADFGPAGQRADEYASIVQR